MDSNTLRAFSNRSDPAHARVIDGGDRVGWDNVGLLVVVVLEAMRGRLLYFDQAQRRDPSHLVIALAAFEATQRVVSAFPCVPFDASALTAHVQKDLFPGTMSRHDRMIAAIALAGDHVLVTRNVGDFSSVPGLRIENWIDGSP